MAKPNYQFEKRQRELAKKKRKEEKARLKSSISDPVVPIPNQTKDTSGS